MSRASSGRPSTCSTGPPFSHGARRSEAPARVYHCAGAAHVGRSWNAAEATLAVNVRGTHHLIEALRDSAPDARLLLPSSALVYAPSDQPLGEEHLLQPVSPYGLSKLAQELVGTRQRRRTTGLRRAAVQSFRPEAGFVVRHVGIRPADRRDRGRPGSARDQGRQPRRGARSHRRSRHGAGLSHDSRTRSRRAPL